MLFHETSPTRSTSSAGFERLGNGKPRIYQRRGWSVRTNELLHLSNLLKQDPVIRTRIRNEKGLVYGEYCNLVHNALRERLLTLTCISFLPDAVFRRRRADWDNVEADIFLPQPSGMESHHHSLKDSLPSSLLAQQQCLELLRYFGDECHFDMILQRMFVGCTACRML